MKLKRVLVCGGRKLSDYDLVAAAMERVRSRIGNRLVVVTGGASGADALAAQWAAVNNLPYWTFPADWDAAPKAGGPIRNREMLENAEPDYGVAFPGGNGTADMVAVLEQAGVPVWKVKPNLNETTS